MLRRPSPEPRSVRGFTLLEMLAVIAIAAILSIVAAAMFDRTAFDTARFGRELEATLAFAQKAAVAQRRTVTVTVGTSSVSLAVCSGFDPCGASVPLALPTQDGGFVLNAPTGVTVSPATFAFAPGGGTDQASAVTLTVTGTDSSSNSLVIEAGTGYVHRS